MKVFVVVVVMTDLVDGTSFCIYLSGVRCPREEDSRWPFSPSLEMIRRLSGQTLTTIVLPPTSDQAHS